MVKVETVGYTLAKVEYQALVKKLSARLAVIKFSTLNTGILFKAVKTLTFMLIL